MVHLSMFALGAILIGYSLWVYSSQPEAAGIWFVPGILLLILAGIMSLLPAIKRWWKS